jgi:hypothetical protein
MGLIFFLSYLFNLIYILLIKSEIALKISFELSGFEIWVKFNPSGFL